MATAEELKELARLISQAATSAAQPAEPDDDGLESSADDLEARAAELEAQKERLEGEEEQPLTGETVEDFIDGVLDQELKAELSAAYRDLDDDGRRKIGHLFLLVPPESRDLEQIIDFAESLIPPEIDTRLPEGFNGSEWWEPHQGTKNELRNWLTGVMRLPDNIALGYLNDEAARIGSQKGYTDYWQFIGDNTFMGGAQRRATGAYLLPRTFRDEEGQYYVNTDVSGPVPINWNPVRPALPQEQLDNIADIDPIEAAWLERNQFQEEITPVIADWQAELRAIMGVSGGGAGMKFDRKAIRQQMTDRYRFHMVEDAPDADDLTDAYIRESTGSRLHLNVDSWLSDRLSKTARWKMLYDKKPAHMSETEYMGSLRGATQGLGFSGGVASRELVSGASSGQSVEGFRQRVSGSREAQVANRGDFSQRLARTVQSLGPLGR